MITTNKMFEKPSRTYATYDNAVSALNRALEKYKTEYVVNYVIGTTADGRFFPIVLGNKHAMIAQVGVCVFG